MQGLRLAKACNHLSLMSLSWRLLPCLSGEKLEESCRILALQLKERSATQLQLHKGRPALPSHGAWRAAFYAKATVSAGTGFDHLQGPANESHIPSEAIQCLDPSWRPCHRFRRQKMAGHMFQCPKFFNGTLARLTRRDRDNRVRIKATATPDLDCREVSG